MIKQAPFLYGCVKGALVFFYTLQFNPQGKISPQCFCCCYCSFASFQWSMSAILMPYTLRMLVGRQLLSFLLHGWGDSGMWNPILVLVGMVTVFAWSPICSWSAVSQISSYTSNRVRSMRGEVCLWKLLPNICKLCAVSFLLVRMSQVMDAQSTLVVGQGRRRL